jgi:uncharacterized lipoprotein YehR (DUF1307 family)
MKSKEVIKLLQELDPTGEIEVCVGNIDIHFIDRLPAYYDGTLQVLQRDDSKQGYDIVGAKYCRKGDKLCIYPFSISDAIIQDSSIIVDYSELNNDTREQLEKQHNELREWYKNIENSMDREYFVNWAMNEANKLTVDLDYFKDEVKAFAEKITFSGLVTKVEQGESYHSMLIKLFSTKYEIVIEDGFLSIVEKE